jgi:hypothetical protein
LCRIRRPGRSRLPDPGLLVVDGAAVKLEGDGQGASGGQIGVGLLESRRIAGVGRHPVPRAFQVGVHLGHAHRSHVLQDGGRTVFRGCESHLQGHGGHRFLAGRN